jgi:hypothetical protein
MERRILYDDEEPAGALTGFLASDEPEDTDGLGAMGVLEGLADELEALAPAELVLEDDGPDLRL